VLGILRSLPHILDSEECVESLSLGAGTSGSDFDLVTDRQIAEFKFTRWRGSDSARQSSLFVDLLNLASAQTKKRRCLYVVGRDAPVRFLKGDRSLKSVLGKHAAAAARFHDLHGVTHTTVGSYYATIADRVEVIDLAGVVPGLADLSASDASDRQ
jgi:hypothetical protein